MFGCCCCFVLLLLEIKWDWAFLGVVVTAVELLEPGEIEGEEGTNGSCEYTTLGISWEPSKSSINSIAKLITGKSDSSCIYRLHQFDWVINIT